MLDMPQEKIIKGKYIVHQTENFNTIFLSENPEKYSAKTTSHLVELLTNPHYRDQKALVLNELKNNPLNGKNLLLQVISDKTYSQHLPCLVAACWESGIDFSSHIGFFVKLSIASHYATCVEVMTLIEQMHGKLPEKDTEKLIAQLRNAISTETSPEKKDMLKLIATLLKNKK
jgi:hypothetical protein